MRPFFLFRQGAVSDAFSIPSFYGRVLFAKSEEEYRYDLLDESTLLSSVVGLAWTPKACVHVSHIGYCL